MRVILFSLVLAAVSFAADAAGRWSGNIEIKSPDGESRARPVLLIFKREGGKLKGSGGPNDDRQISFINVGEDETRLMFEVDDDGTTAKFDVKVEGDEMKGEAKISHDGQAMDGKFILKREK
ncbi:MAG TPA: hypothetical protein VM120_19710 [Bryobacteraceae bacterium]|nr:hypothetical protein [Bryobacteraceae bacterium]